MSQEKDAMIVSDVTTAQTAQVFALPEILPKHMRIVLDVQAHLALLIEPGEEKPVPWVRLFQLSPSAIRIFLALLQAYPQYCPYPTLVLALYPATEEAPAEEWEQYVRPIRRALRYLSPTLRDFGLEVVALRGHGYLLSASTRIPALPKKWRAVS